MRPRKPPAVEGHRTTLTSCRQPSGSGATAPALRSRASCSNAAITPCATSARRRSSPHDLLSCAHAPCHADAPRPAPGILLPPRPRGRPPKTERPHRTSPSGNHTPFTIMSPAGNRQVVDRDKHGRPRAHTADSASTAPVKRSALGPPGRPTGDRTAAAGAQSQRVIRGRARGPHRQQTSTRGGLDRGAAAQISRSTERTRTGPARWPSLRESSMSSRWWLEPGQACVGGGRHGGRGGV